MKTSYLRAAAAAAFAAVVTPCLHAQTLTITAPGYSAVKLFDTSPGQTINGVDFDVAGNVYYLQSAATGTSVLRRSPGDNYTVATPLFSYPSAVFGSFLKLDAGKLYFGESSNGTIRTFDLTSSTTSTLATVAFNYDLALGSGGSFLSAAPTGSNNQVFSLNTTTGATQSKLTTSDFSGPVALDLSGRLYYGGTQFGVGGKIYRYSASEAAAGGLALDAAHVWANNSGNAFFAFNGGSSLFQTDFGTLNLFDTNQTTSTAIALGSSVDSIGNLAARGGVLLASVTAYNGAPSSDDQSAVFRVVPEPTAASLLLAGLLGLGLQRRRR